MSTESNGNGRKPPPAEGRFGPGQSGNPRGRPKGAISTKLLTKKVALKRVTRDANGKKQTLTLLECVVLTARTMAMEGHAGAAALVDELLIQMRPPEPESGVGFLVVPEMLTAEEADAMVERHNAEAIYEPGTPDYEKYGPYKRSSSSRQQVD